VTQVVPLKAFYPAEAYHQDYAALHPKNPYIVYNDAPKVAHLREQFPGAENTTPDVSRGEDLSPAVRRALIATQARTQTFVAFRNEMGGAFVSAQQAGGIHSFGDLPLVVVKFFPAGEKETVPMNEKWMRLQDELAQLSTNSVHMVSETATHGIAREQPEFVIAAIRKALQLAVAHQTELGEPGLPLNGQISGKPLNN